MQVAKEENESGYVDVTISGTKDQIRLAKRLLFGCGITFTGGNDEDPGKERMMCLMFVAS